MIKDNYLDLYKAEFKYSAFSFLENIYQFIDELDSLGISEKIRMKNKQDIRYDMFYDLIEIDVPNRNDLDLISKDIYKNIILRNFYDKTIPLKYSRQICYKTIKRQYDKICHNALILKQNEQMIYIGHNDENRIHDGGWSMSRQAFQIFQEYYSIPSERHRLCIQCLQILYAKWKCFSISCSENLRLRYCCFSNRTNDIIKILEETPYDADEDLLIMNMNRIIDMAHRRGPLASAFVEGGEETCKEVSEMKIQGF